MNLPPLACTRTSTRVSIVGFSRYVWDRKSGKAVDDEDRRRLAAECLMEKFARAAAVRQSGDDGQRRMPGCSWPPVPPVISKEAPRDPRPYHRTLAPTEKSTHC